MLRLVVGIALCGGCIDWNRHQPADSAVDAIEDAGVQPDGRTPDAEPDADDGDASLIVAPRCVPPGSDTAVRWSDAEDCTPIGFEASLDTDGCATVRIDAPTTLGVRCDEDSTVDVLVDADTSIDPEHELYFSDEIVVDGMAMEWGVLGRIERTAGNPSVPDDIDDLDARFGIRWNDRGLFFVVQVFDDDSCPAVGVVGGSLWRFDGAELILDIGADRNDDRSGFDATEGDAQIFFSSLGQSGSIASSLDIDSVEHSSTTVAGAYTVEALVPWSIFGVTPAPGDRLKVNVAVNDLDIDSDTMECESRVGADPPALVFHYSSGHPFDFSALPTYTLRCGDAMATCD